MSKPIITVTTSVAAPIETVWNCWTLPQHIVEWNFASDSWHTPRAENDLRVGGRLLWRMEAKDGSFGFDFCGTYEQVEAQRLIVYRLDDDRMVTVRFEELPNAVRVTEAFEAELTHPLEMQQAGWQAILNSFKKHVDEQASKQ